MNLSPLIQTFALHFGEMGSRWGINRTVGQIYALLYLFSEPLNAEEIVRVAVRAGADAVYPGYGFLSENPALAEACANAGITFIGPTADVLTLTGNKARANAAGRESRDIYRINLAILEAFIRREDVPVPTTDERELGSDLDGDGVLGTARRVALLHHSMSCLNAANFSVFAAALSPKRRPMTMEEGPVLSLPP